MSIALDMARLKASGGKFGPEVATAAENVMCFLDELLDRQFLFRKSSDPPPVHRLPRGYYFDVAGGGRMQLCMPEVVDPDEQAQRIFARDVAPGLLEEICEALGPEHSEPIRSHLDLEG